MKTRLQLVRRQVIPRDQHVIVRMRKPQPVSELVILPEEVAPFVTPLPMGTDRWYDSTRRSMIPFRQIDNESCPDTPNYIGGISGFGDFDIDDNGDYEGDYIFGQMSAWWQLNTAPDAAHIKLSADTWLTINGPANPGPLPPDTVLELFTTDEPLPLGPGRFSDPLPTDLTDFSTLISTAYSDDDPDVGGGPTLDNFLSKFADVPLAPGKAYWIRVSLYGYTPPNNSGHGWDTIYRLRLKLSFD